VVLAASGSAIAVAVAVAVGCIPDLPADSVDAQDEAAPPPGPPRCGDGIIQLGDEEQCDPGVLAEDAAIGSCTRDCKMTCAGPPTGFVWSRNNHCYTLVATQAASLDQTAVGDCTGGSHVLTLASEQELQAVTSSMTLGAPDAFWMGLDPVIGPSNEYTALAFYEPGWAPTCPGCFAHDSPTVPLPGSGGCVEAFSDPDASWQQYPCSDAGKIHVICEREPTAGVQSQKCDGGVCIDLVWTFPQKQYVYVSQKLGGDDAEAYCEALGGTLVILQSRDEREQLWRELSRMAGVGVPTDIWIGLSFVDAGWVWGDDASLDAYPSPFGNGQPKGIGSRAYLVQSSGPPQPLDTTLGHNDVVSTTALSFVCQLPGSPGLVGP
jgi:hypothetical protein